MDESRASWAMTGQTHLSLQLAGFPVTGVRALSPIWRWLAAGGCSPNTKPMCAFAVLMSKSTRKGNKGWKRKGKVQNGSKDGFEVEPRSGDQEVRAVIAAGYQFPFLFWDRPQPAGVCPSESSRSNTHLCRRTGAAGNWRATETKLLFAFPMQRQTKYLEHVWNYFYYFWTRQES